MTRINVAFLRPPFVQPFESKNILIEDITLKNSPFWNINPVFVNNITIRGVKVEAPYPSPNTDGIDVDSCVDVLIERVSISCGDDCIVLKSGRDLQGRRIGRPTENVVIRDSHMFKGMSGFAIGSQQSGGVRNVKIENIVMNGTDKGVFIKSMRGRGGIVEDIKVRNISMINIKREMVGITLLIHTNQSDAHKAQPFSERTPVLRDIEFNDLMSD